MINWQWAPAQCPQVAERVEVVFFLFFRLESGLHQYAEFVQNRSEDSQSLLVQDPRSEEERTNAADLQATVTPAQPPPPAFTQDHRPSSSLQSKCSACYFIIWLLKLAINHILVPTISALCD